jgi:hypothetical protein
MTAALIEYARSSIMYEKQLLRELEALGPDVDNAAKVVPISNGAPKPPAVIPPLEDFSLPPPVPRSESLPPPLPKPAVRPPPIHPPASSAYNPDRPLTSSSTLPSIQQDMRSASFNQSYVERNHLPSTPLSANQSFGSGDPLSSSSSRTLEPQRQPLSSPPPPVTVSTLPTTPTSAAVPSPLAGDEPPLGGRLVSSKSIFVKSTSSPLSASFPSPSNSTFGQGPLQRAQAANMGSAGTLGRAVTSPLASPSTNGYPTHEAAFDPLGQAKVTSMSSSLRVQPSRPRLDAREAASKLANMF